VAGTERPPHKGGQREQDEEEQQPHQMGIVSWGMEVVLWMVGGCRAFLK